MAENVNIITTINVVSPAYLKFAITSVIEDVIFRSYVGAEKKTKFFCDVSDLYFNLFLGF